MTFTTDVSIKRGESYTLQPPFTRKNEIPAIHADDNWLLSTAVSAFRNG